MGTLCFHFAANKTSRKLQASRFAADESFKISQWLLIFDVTGLATVQNPIDHLFHCFYLELYHLKSPPIAHLFWSDVNEADDNVLQYRWGRFVLVFLLQGQRLVEQISQRGQVIEQSCSRTDSEIEKVKVN